MSNPREKFSILTPHILLFWSVLATASILFLILGEQWLLQIVIGTLAIEIAVCLAILGKSSIGIKLSSLLLLL